MLQKQVANNFVLETVAKKVEWPKNKLLIKNPQFLPNPSDTQAILPAHEFGHFHQVS